MNHGDPYDKKPDALSVLQVMMRVLEASASASFLRLFAAEAEEMRILIVDDDETFCRLLTEILEGMGMAAAWTTSGMSAYGMIADGGYDLCIIDVRMPLVLGTDLAEAIREDCPRVKIILASAFADETLQEYASRMDILLLSKPFSTNLLLATLERALGESICRN